MLALCPNTVWLMSSCVSDAGSDLQATLSDMYGVFLFLIIGLFLSAITMGIEFWVASYRESRLFMPKVCRPTLDQLRLSGPSAAVLSLLVEGDTVCTANQHSRHSHSVGQHAPPFDCKIVGMRTGPDMW